MGEYSFTDLRIGDSVLIRTGKKKGQTGTVIAISTNSYFVKLDSGQNYPIKFGTMLQRIKQPAYPDDLKSKQGKSKREEWHIY